jgi:lipoprotein-releasing system permease protein
MTVAFRIALRYFFSKSQQTVINRINAFALFMVVVATATLFIVLSAFDGLKDFGLSFSNRFDPDFEIQPAQGKFFTFSPEEQQSLLNFPGVVAISPVIEEKVFLSFKEKSQVAYLKGVSENYSSVIAVADLIMIGDWLDFQETNNVVAGFGIAAALSLGVYDYTSYLNIAVPKKQEAGVFSGAPFNQKAATVMGLYQISEDLDKKYVFSSADFAQQLLGLDSLKYSAVVIKTRPKIDRAALQKTIQQQFKSPVVLVSRAEQNAALYRMLNLENAAIYFIFTLVMIIALFNVIGALIMMVLDKKKQMKILLAMGVAPRDIHRIFLILGIMICFFGGVIGLILSSGVVLLQETAPFIYVPGTSLPYPVVFTFKNLFNVFFTLMFLGTLSALWATRGLHRKMRHQAIHS